MNNPENALSPHGLAEPPVPGPEAGRQALRALLEQRNVLAALEVIYNQMGEVFRIPLPGFSPVFLVGPEANRFVTVTGRDDLRWRSEGDPVTGLLRQGLLVTDGAQHDELRRRLQPPLHKGMLPGYVEAMVRHTDGVSDRWLNGKTVDMLVEMRRVALLILVETLFKVDLNPEMDRLWPALMRTLGYISPGLWLIWPDMPRLGYRRALQEMDRILYGMIAGRRAALQGAPAAGPVAGDDMLSALVKTPGMSDDLIRDQLLTILIAGHDTSTALLAWTLLLLGRNPASYARVQAEVDQVFEGQAPTIEGVQKLDYLDKVVNETLRLYPPIHIGNRIAAHDLEFQGYRIPAGTRVVYSIYLTHRQAQYWPEPGRFDPERFSPEQARQRPHYTFMPFGGGPRNCIGLAFAQVEVKVVLARLLQRFDLKLVGGEKVHPHMGATLEPRPGVRMRIKARGAK